MKIYKDLSLAILLCATIFCVSCDSFFSQEPENFIDREYMEYATYAQGVLFYAYTRIPSSYQFEDVATDNAVANDMSNANNLYANFRRAASGEWSPFFDPTDTWSASYSAINNVNFFLTFANDVVWENRERFPERDKLFRERYDAEARGLRGYHYLRLLSRYGGVATNGSLLGVPVTPGFVTDKDNVYFSRPSFQTTLEQVYADLDYAIKGLPYIFKETADSDSNYVYKPADNRSRINGQIVWALKVRAALLDASPAYNDGVYNLEKATFAAKVSGELLKKNGGLSSLASDHIFWNDDNDANNPEIMWRATTTSNRTFEEANYPPSLYGNGRINPTQNLVDAFPMKNGYPISATESNYDPNNPYSGRDSRLRLNIIVNGDVLRSTTINTSADGTNNDALNKLSQYSTRTGYYIRKLLRENVNCNPTSANNAQHFYTYIRWTEIFLAYAEAANEAFGPDSDPNGYGFTPRGIIAAIRKRAGIEQPDSYLASITTKEAMRDLIRNERRLELCFEDHRFWDIRRWNLPLNETAKGVSITGGNFTIIDVEPRTFQPYMIYCPIPNSEIIKYPELLQNNDW